MPAWVIVSNIYRQELLARSAERMKEAGANWLGQFQSFYFGSEEAIDQCALTVFRRSLEIDEKEVTEESERRVMSLIKRSTITKAAVDVIYQTCKGLPSR